MNYTLTSLATTPVSYSALPSWPGNAYVSKGTLHIGTVYMNWPTWTDNYYGPTTGPSASAASCNAKWAEYSSRSSSFNIGYKERGSYTTSWTYPYGICETSFSLEQYTDTHTGPVTKLCDGVPRAALGETETITYYRPGPDVPCRNKSSTYTGETYTYFTLKSTPDCTFSTEDCPGILQAYTSRSAVWRSAYEQNASQTILPSPWQPWTCIRPWTPPPITTTSSYNYCLNCQFHAWSATLFYWPEQSVSSVCLSNGSTTNISFRDRPSTALLNGITLTSPSLYLSYGILQARSTLPQGAAGGAAGLCGGNYSDILMTLHPSEVSSARDHNSEYRYSRSGTLLPFNVGDMNSMTIGNRTIPLVPWSAYTGGANCPVSFTWMRPYNCTMVRNDYKPWLAYPPAIRAIDPLWSRCDTLREYPTVSLVPIGGAGFPSVPTTALKTATVPPSPESTAAAPTPTATLGYR